MSLFTYEALDEQGRRKKGEIDSDSERSVRQTLRAQGLMVRKLVQIENANKQKGEATASQRLNSAETVNFLQQLATLIDSGMPLVEALASIAEGMENARSCRVVASIRDRKSVV